MLSKVSDMALNKYRLGDLIEIVDEKNNNLLYSVECVRGISTQKFFIETKANMEGVSLSGYKIVYPECFAYVPDTSRRGDKISLAFNNTNNTYLVSTISVVFKVKKSNKLLSNYLFMFFNRPEFDRYSRYNSFGSAREPFNWSDMCDIELELPDLETQQKFVNMYLSMVENQKSYERGLNDLKLVCDGYIEDLRRKIPCEKIGKYIECTDRKTDDSSLKIQGISNQHKLNDSNSRVDGVETSKYLRISSREFGYSPIHINDGSIAFNNSNESYLLSPIYKTFKVIDENKLISEYLMLWLSRDEFTRYCTFHAFGSARDTFEWVQMCEVQIPIPNLEIQKSIVEIFNALNLRKQINEKLKEQIKNICPVLIKGSIEEARGE